MCVTHRCLSPRFRRTMMSTGVTDWCAGQGVTDRIQRHQRDRGEKQYLAPHAQSRQDEPDRLHHLATNSSRGARRWLPHRMHPSIDRLAMTIERQASFPAPTGFPTAVR